MSRTDIHRPTWVQALDPTIRHWFADFHNHEDGICDLAENLHGGWVYGPRQHCYRQPWTQAPNLCGCRLCTWSYGRQYAHKQERMLWRALRQELLKTDTADLTDADVPPLRGSAW